MGVIEDKLTLFRRKTNYLIDTKERLRQEINRAYGNEEIGASATFNSYIQKLEEQPFYVKGLIDGTIESIKITDATSIGDSTFRSCSGLITASFPNATSIGYGAFYSCSKLTTIYVGTNTSTVCTLSSTSAFTDCTNLASIYVPANLVNSYKSATNWSSYANKIKAAP